MLGPIIIGLCSLLFISACNNSSSHSPSPVAPAAPAPQENAPTAPPLSFKPLPVSCDEALSYTIQWPVDSNAFGYTVILSFKEGGDGQSFSFDGLESKTELLLERGVKYFVRVEKSTLNQTLHGNRWSFDVPTCTDRTEWKKDHPEYEEPATASVSWN